MRTPALILALGLALASPLAAAHARLKSSTPADGAALAAAPGELRLHFDEPVEVAMSSIKVLGPGDAAPALAAVAADPADARTLVQALPALPPGAYRVQWSTLGRDGHRTKGEIHFAVK